MSKPLQSERHHWQYIKAAGKGRFVRRWMLGSLVSGVVILLGLALLDRSPLHSARVDFLMVIVLPIFLLVGYLTANRRWQDLEKKFSEDRLPPWE